MRRLQLAIHVIALTTCLATYALPQGGATMPGLRRAIEAIADPSKFVRPATVRSGIAL